MHGENRWKWFAATGAALVMLAGISTANASSVDGNGSLIAAGSGHGKSVVSWYNLTQVNSQEGWQIGNAPVVDDGSTGPQGVYLSRKAGPWVKKLSLLGDNIKPPTDSATNSDLTPPSLSYVLREYLQIGKGPAWTDWHESISGPFLPIIGGANSSASQSTDSNSNNIASFGRVAVKVWNTSTSMFETLAGVKIRNAGNQLAMFFANPLPVNTILQIDKQVTLSLPPIWTASQPTDGTGTGPYLKVAEYPTSVVPAPASLTGGAVLLMLLLPLALVWRKRQTMQ